MLPTFTYHHIVRIVHEPHRIQYLRLELDEPDPKYAETYCLEYEYCDAAEAVCINIYETYVPGN